MTTNLTNRLLKKAARISAEYQDIQNQLTDAFNERYGVTYSDVDADGIIDVLDYGGGDLTVEDCDAIMAATGNPPKGWDEDDNS